MPVHVTIPVPALRAAIPIHQLGTTNSLPPRRPPCRLNSANTMPSCMNCHPPRSAGGACVDGALCARREDDETPSMVATNTPRETKLPDRIIDASPLLQKSDFD